MRLNQLFFQTLREAPGDVEIASHQLLLRAGYIRQLGTGIFSYLPLARRSMDKIERIMRDEINAIGGQEITMPVIHPADLWQETGRWYQVGAEMGRFTDRNDHPMVLGMTHEEVVADLTRQLIRSYRQLPALVYQIQTKWRDEPRPRAGLIRVREFTMLDSYSLDATWEGLEAQYQAHYEAYHRIYARCGLPVKAVQSDTGMMGGKLAHEFMYLNPIGEDMLIFCDSCGYQANRQVARTRKVAAEAEPALPLEKVATPHASTIEELAAFLQIPASRTAKAVFLMAEVEGNSGETYEQFVFAIVRGDCEVNETKLANALGARDLRPAREEEIRAIGAEPGYASPVGLPPNSRAWVVVDELIPLSANLVAGANQAGYHLRNTNYGRDYSARLVTDLTAAQHGDPCPECGAPLRAERGVEVGNIFQLGTRYTDALGCTFSDANGEQKPVIMGSYGIGVGRLLACLAEEYHDGRGLCLPAAVAPFDVHLIVLQSKTTDLAPQAEELYRSLQTHGLEVLYDDRVESAGVKFMDADLIGCPLRITVSERALGAGGVEFKLRRAEERSVVPLDEAAAEALRRVRSAP